MTLPGPQMQLLAKRDGAHRHSFVDREALHARRPSCAGAASKDMNAHGTPPEVEAILIMCATQLANVTMYAGAKWLGARAYPPLEISAGRFFFAALVAVIVVFAWHGLTIPRIRRIGTHILRSLFLLGSNGFSFAALQYLKLADVQAVLYLSPFVTTAAALLILREPLRPRVVPGMIIAFIGMILVLRPDAEISWATFLAVGMTICSGLLAVTTRALGKTEPPAVTLLFSVTMTAIAATLASFAFSTPVFPAPLDVGAMAVVGFAGGVSQLGLIIAHRLAPACTLAPFVYAQMPFALLLGFLMFGELPDLGSATGIVLIVGAGIWVAAYKPSRDPRPAGPQSAEVSN